MFDSENFPARFTYWGVSFVSINIFILLLCYVIKNTLAAATVSIFQSPIGRGLNERAAVGDFPSGGFKFWN